MELKISFPGGVKVNADYKGYIIQTDQPLKSGGEESAPSPLDLFIASLGTCAGYYVLNFCKSRGLSVENIEIIQNMNYNSTTKLFDKIDIEIKLPADFPEKYKDAVVNAANLCAVKKHLHNPPEISVFTTSTEPILD